MSSNFASVGSTMASAVNAVAAQAQQNQAAGTAQAAQNQKAGNNAKAKEQSGTAAESKAGMEVAKNQAAEKNGKVTGRVVGNPKLSEKAAKYYEDLKKRYGNLEFVLVSKDQKAAAQANAGSFANANKMVVLIDEEKIERMAEDENYRKQYEGIIGNAASGLSQLAKSLGNTPGVKNYGAKINDNGTASFFAVMDKSFASQKERIAKNAAKKKETKKAEEKKSAKKEKEEKLEKSRTDRAERSKVRGVPKDEDEVTITASSVEELMKKVNDFYMEGRSNMVETDKEKQLGHNIDYFL